MRCKRIICPELHRLSRLGTTKSTSCADHRDIAGLQKSASCNDHHEFKTEPQGPEVLEIAKTKS